MESILTKFTSNKSRLLLILVCVLFCISMSCVSAADHTNVTIDNNANNHIDAGFDVLQNDIKNLNPGDVYNIDKDYTFNYNSPIPILGDNAIEIGADNVTINGNGHVIDGNFQTSILKVTGNNVKILDLTFTHSQYNGFNIPVVNYDVGKVPGPIVVKDIHAYFHTDNSPVCWLGNNGYIDSCTFLDNTAINGAGLTWQGNNGTIKNSKFINNTAKGIGGAIYIGNVNNTRIENCTFSNSTSLSGEAIYLDRKHGKYNLTNNHNLTLIDGTKCGIDVEYLKYDYPLFIADKKINIIPYLYKTMLNNVNYIDNETCCGYQINVNEKNETIFVLNLLREFNADNIVYQKDLMFLNPTDLNNIFASLLNDTFQVDAAIIKSVNVKNDSDYQNLFKLTFNKNVNETPAMKAIKIDTSQSKINPKNCLLIKFKPELYIYSLTPFKIDKDFNVVNINGNRATIFVTTNESDEYTWLENENQYYSISDLTISGFNHGIINRFCCILNQVTFTKNHILYSICPEDWGPAILNLGTCKCSDCTFSDNKARCGGAIFNQGSLTLEDCLFYNNEVAEKNFINDIGLGHSGIGKDICNACNGNVNICSDSLINSPIVENAGGLKATGHNIVNIAIPFIAGLAGTIAAGISRSPTVGCAVGATAGLLLGLLGSSYVCYNTFDATFGYLKYSIQLTAISTAVGGVTGLIAGYIASKIDEVPERPTLKTDPMKFKEKYAGGKINYKYKYASSTKKVMAKDKQVLYEKIMELEEIKEVLKDPNPSYYVDVRNQLWGADEFDHITHTGYIVDVWTVTSENELHYSRHAIATVEIKLWNWDDSDRMFISIR